MPAITTQEKYHDANPVVRFLLNRFFGRIHDAVYEAAPVTVLDAGCGEGELVRRGVLPAGLRVTSLDLRPEALALFRAHSKDLSRNNLATAPFGHGSVTPLGPSRDQRERCPNWQCGVLAKPERNDLVCASVQALPFADRSMDAVLCLEVLEHLERPQLALAELARVARHRVILSVPHEPYFRLGNLVRGKHLSGWGNHPEHVQHWNPATFQSFLQPTFAEVRVVEAFPWIVASCAVPR